MPQGQPTLWHFLAAFRDMGPAACSRAPLRPRSRLQVAFTMATALVATLAAHPALAVTYLWNVNGSGDYQQAANWSPTRTTPAASDVLIIDKGVPVTLSNVPTQTISQVLITSGTNCTMTSTAANTLTIAGGSGADFDLQFGGALTLSGSNAVTISIASGATASMSGVMSMTGAAHRLIGADAGAVTFNPGAGFTANTGLIGNPFGTAPAGSVVFASGSTYTHVSGSSPFGNNPPAAAVAVFQPGSLFTIRNTSGYQSGGRTYANLTVDIQPPGPLTGNGTGNFQFQTLTVNPGNSFTHNGSGTSRITIAGEIVESSSNNINLLSGSGGIMFAQTGTQTIAGSGTGSVFISSAATVQSGTTLALSRTLSFSGAGGLTVAGNLQINDSGVINATPTYSGNGSLIYNAPNSVNIGNEWNSGTNVGLGVPLNVTLTSNSATVTMPTSNRTCPGDLTINGGTFVLNTTSGNLSIGGDWTDNAAFTANGRTVTFNGFGDQTITKAGEETFSGFTVNSGGNVHATTGTNLRVDGTLAFSHGKLVIDGTTNRISVSPGGTVTGASPSTGWVVGRLRKTVEVSGTAGSQTWEIGDLGRYSAVDVGGASFSGNFDAIMSTTSGLHPNYSGSGLDLTQRLDRYYVAIGTPTGPCDATLHYDPADIVGGADFNTFLVRRFASPSWFAETVASRSATSIQVGGVAAFGDFAVAEVLQHVITASAGTGGSIAPSGPTFVADGTSQGFVITPSACRRIADVLVDGVSVGVVPTFTFNNVTASHTIAASFALDTLAITASAGAGGTISPSGMVRVGCGADTTFTISPAACFTIADVLIDSVSVGAVASHTFTNVTANHTISATFALKPPLTIAASAGAGGAIAPAGDVSVACGTDRTFTLTPDSCQRVVDVLVDGASVGAVASYTFTNVTAGHTIAATFGPRLYTVTASAGPGGTLTPSGAVSVACDSARAFTIAPAACYHVADVVVDGSSVGAVTTYTFTNVTANHTIAVSFALNTETITASAGAGGAISPSGAVSVNCGADQGFTITPGTCFTIAAVLVDGGSVGAVSSYTFTNVTANHTISATFSMRPPLTITASAGAGGSISPSGAVSVPCGDDSAFTITPAADRHVADVLVDGASVGAVTSYTFTNVTTNHTIAASFALNTYTLSVVVVGGGTVTPTPNQASYPSGTIVSLSAAANSGWHFSGWSGDASGATNPLAVTMTSNKTITATFQQNVYTWNPTGTEAWATAANWTPTRQAVSTDDVLIFSNGATTTATGVPTQTVGQLLISGNTTLTLQADAAVTLTVGGGAGTDFNVAGGATLNLSGVNAIKIALGAAASGTVGGRISATNGPHNLNALGANTLVFQSGSVITTGTGFTGNVFGTGSGSSALNSVLFQSGSVYVQIAGANPFGATQPSSVVTFQTGSRYRLEGSITPAFSGRVYADFEHNQPGSTTTTGSAALKIDNLVITQGTMNCNMTGAFDLKGDITVNPGATLNFLPASGTPAVSLSGALPQTITVNGALTESTNETIEVKNGAGVTLATNVTLAGGLRFTTGILHTGSNTLAVTGASGSVSGAGVSTGWVDGNLRRSIAAGSSSRAFDVGDTFIYAPVTVAVTGAGSGFDLTGSTETGDHADVIHSGIDPTRSVNRTWTLTPVGSPNVGAYDATFNFVGSDVDAGATPSIFQVGRYDGTWHPTTVGVRTATSTQATGLTAFGDFEVGQPAQYTLTTLVAGSGTVSRSPNAPSYPGGTVVTLTATPAAGWAFQGWSGDVTSALNPLTVTMDQNVSLTATFADVQPPTVMVDSPNGGEKLLVGYVRTLTWAAGDNARVTSVDLYLSRDGGLTFPETIAAGVANTGSFDWTATPPATNDEDDQLTCLLRVVAHDGAGNSAADTSDAGFEIINLPVTAVDPNAPTEFALSRIAPNPAFGPARIEFTVARAARVRLEVLDVQGRLVATLVDGEQPAGRYQVTWNGEPARGVKGAGVFFVRYHAADVTRVKRLIMAH